MDAWVGAAMALAATAIVFRSSRPISWHGIALITALLALLPALQCGFGLVLWSGSAWVSCTYVLGFLLTLLTGAEWERNSPGRWADALFLAIGVTGLLSVGLQLDQWLVLEALDGLSMGKTHGRPFANFGQPNQLATFLLWGLLAAVWGLLQRQIGRWTALMMMLTLLFGLALTQSRTAWLAMGLLVMASWIWRRLWPDHRWPWLTSGLALYFAVLVACLDRLNQLLLLGSVPGAAGVDRVGGALRQTIWSLFADAALQRPWVGYGWNQLGPAQVAAALNHPSLEQPHAHAHNLFLDLVLWCGLPIGIALSLYLVRWIWLRARSTKTAQDAVLMLFLLVIGLHAMLELPLYYAYFLLPVGLVMGALNVRLDVRPMLCTPRWPVQALCGLTILLLVLIVRDYLRVESSHQELRFEQARIQSKTPWQAPDLLLLNQFSESFRLARFVPTREMRQEDLDWMRKVSETYPSAATLPKLALALALNRQATEALSWLQTVCKLESELRCEGVRQYWAEQTLIYPELTAAPWPHAMVEPSSR